MQARAQAVWAEFAARGLPVWQSTITPRTTSTDNWATVANQTLASTSVEPVRTAFNDWLRASWPVQGLAGLIEAADTVEVNAAGAAARNGGRWRVDKGQPTIDGTHPAGGLTDATVMGSALNLSALV